MSDDDSEDTIFHKIMRKEISSKFLYEDDDLFVIRDITPAGPIHLLVIPKKTIPTANALTPADDALVGKMVRVARDLAEENGVSESGYRLVMNCGEDGGQTVYQLHLHMIGGRGLHWPPG